jgi:3-isopropylmalate/(R)-2-methylmalate dehydratase small subunit
VQENPALLITVDVEARTITAEDAGISSAFPLDDSTRERFLNGLDDIGLTLQHADAIAAFEANRPEYLPTAPA